MLRLAFDALRPEYPLAPVCARVEAATAGVRVTGPSSFLMRRCEFEIARGDEVDTISLEECSFRWIRLKWEASVGMDQVVYSREDDRSLVFFECRFPCHQWHRDDHGDYTVEFPYDQALCCQLVMAIVAHVQRA